MQVHERRPPLSIVVASRNDSHGGDLLVRMEIFVRGLLAQTRRHRIDAELIVVEWNPPADRPLLHQVMPAPGADDRLTIRYIIVPAEVHQRYRCAATLGLFQMIAKNVGIRRANGTSILCTNVDLLFSDALCEVLAGGSFAPDAYYRANRCDVPAGLDPRRTVEEQLAWCERHVVARAGRDPRYRHINLELLGLQHKHDFKKWVFDKIALRLPLTWPREKLLYYQLDTVACGDFTLMSRDAWFSLQGHLELDLYSLYVDSLAVVGAAALGYRQAVLPRKACTYHLGHSEGWSDGMAPLDRLRFVERRPSLDYALFHDLAIDRLRHRQGFALNGSGWGYPDVAFEERTLSPAPIASVAALVRETVG